MSRSLPNPRGLLGDHERAASGWYANFEEVEKLLRNLCSAAVSGAERSPPPRGIER